MGNQYENFRKAIYRLNRNEIIHIFGDLKEEIREMDDMDIRTHLLNEMGKGEKLTKELMLSIFIGELERLQKVYRRVKKEEDARRIDELRLMISNNTAYLNNNVAVPLMRQEKYDEAKPLLEKAVNELMAYSRLDPDTGGIMENYFCTLYNLKEYEAIIDACQKFIKKVERKGGSPAIKRAVLILIYLALGDAFLKILMKEEALGVFMRAYMMDPGNTCVKLSLAEYYDAVDDYDSVKKICLEVIEKDKKCCEAYFRLAMAYVFTGEREEAKKYLYESYKLDPSDHAARSNLLHCLYELGRVKVPTNCDEDDYIDELAESKDADKIINQECGGSGRESIRKMIESIFEEGENNGKCA